MKGKSSSETCISSSIENLSHIVYCIIGQEAIQGITKDSQVSLTVQD